MVCCLSTDVMQASESGPRTVLRSRKQQAICTFSRFGQESILPAAASHPTSHGMLSLGARTVLTDVVNDPAVAWTESLSRLYQWMRKVNDLGGMTRIARGWDSAT